MGCEMGGVTGIRTRKHPDKALTVVAIRAVKKPAGIVLGQNDCFMTHCVN